MARVAIVGTRSPDPTQRELAAWAAFTLSEAGLFIITGGADGIDSIAMSNTKPGQLEVILPWADYNKALIPSHARVTVLDRTSWGKHKLWYDSVNRYHPNPGALTHGARKLHARNYGIMEPAAACIALPDENGAGGTGQAIRISQERKLPLLEFRKYGAGKSWSMDMAKSAVQGLITLLPA